MISVVTSILPIVGRISGGISWWKSIDEAKQSEYNQLSLSLEYAQEILSDCEMTASSKERINDQLHRAMNLLKLKNDLESARALYDNVDDELVNCSIPMATPEPAPGPPIETPQTPSTPTELLFDSERSGIERSTTHATDPNAPNSPSTPSPLLTSPGYNDIMVIVLVVLGGISVIFG